MRRVAAFAPPTIGNVIVGFDILGVAIQDANDPHWGDVISVAEQAGDAVLRVNGPFAHEVPHSLEDNIVGPVAKWIAKHCGQEFGDLAITLTKNLPVGSGLGSSAASAAATAVALNGWYGDQLEPAGIIAAAAVGEKHACGSAHLDNIVPCICGGLLLCDAVGLHRRLPWPEELVFVVASPELTLNTKRARKVLTADVALRAATLAMRRAMQFVAAVCNDDLELLRHCLADELIEPQREHLIPGFLEAKQAACDAGALGCSLSGSGPAVLAIASQHVCEDVGLALADAFDEMSIATTVRICTVDTRGATLLPEHDQTDSCAR